MAAKDCQVGGDHYRQMAIQPAEFIYANEIGFLEGNIIKYACRHKYKNGAQDILKIKHYCDLILEFEYKGYDSGQDGTGPEANNSSATPTPR